MKRKNKTLSTLAAVLLLAVVFVTNINIHELHCSGYTASDFEMFFAEDGDTASEWFDEFLTYQNEEGLASDIKALETLYEEGSPYITDSDMEYGKALGLIPASYPVGRSYVADGPVYNWQTADPNADSNALTAQAKDYKGSASASGASKAQSMQTETAVTEPQTKETVKENSKNTKKTEDNAEPAEDEIENAWYEESRTDATCTADGIIIYKNSLDDSLTKEETIPAKGHRFEVTESVDATCTKDGYKEMTCSVCGITETETIPAKGHTESDWITKTEAGMFKSGEKEITCTACGEVLQTETIPATCPLSIGAVVGIAIGVAAIICGMAFFVIRRKKSTEQK